MLTLPYRQVPALNGYRWIHHAWGMYRHNPLMWIGYSVAIVMLGAGLSLLPYLGSFLFQLIAPALNGGLMLAARDQQQHQPLKFNHLFAAFHSHGAQLVTIGGIYMTGMMLAFTIPSFFSDDPLIHALLYSAPNALPPLIAHAHLSLTAALVLIASLTLFTVMLMTYWFAPALVVLADFKAIAAMKLSLAACAANFPAFIVYGMLMLILLVLGSLPMMLGYLVVIPLGFISYFSAYEDLFDPAERIPTP